MARIDFKKAYDFVAHSWILECLDMLGIIDNVRRFLEKSMKKSNLLLNSNRSDLCEVDVSRAIFQGILPLIFVIRMIPLYLPFRKVKASYEWGRKEFELNNLLFMDDLKFFAKSVDQIDSLVQTILTFSEDFGMEFGLKKRGVVILKKGKLVKFDGIHYLSKKKMKEVEENGYTYLGLPELDEIKEHKTQIKVTVKGQRSTIWVCTCVNQMKCFSKSKAQKNSALSNLKILWKKKTSRKLIKTSLKINGTKRECMDSLLVKCLKK